MADVSEIKTLVEQGNDHLREKTDEFAAKNAELTDRLNAIETTLGRPGAPGITTKQSPLVKEAKQLRAFLEDGTGLERKDVLSQGTGAQGGFALPEEIAQTVLNQMIDISPIRSIARVVQTMTSDYKMLVGVRGATIAWNAESTVRAETDTPEMAEIAPTSGELWAYPTISQFALDDLIIDPAAWLQQNVADAFAQAEGSAFVSGNGTNKPTGFLNGTPVSSDDDSRAFGTLQYVPTGAAAALGTDPADTLLEMVYTIGAGYRRNAVWLMNSKTAGEIRKTKSESGDYLWSDILVGGQPPTLLGHRVVIAEDMPDVGADAFPIAFGDFQRGYLVTDRIGLRIIRDEITRPGFVRYLIGKRVGGALLDSNAIKLLKVAST